MHISLYLVILDITATLYHYGFLIYYYFDFSGLEYHISMFCCYLMDFLLAFFVACEFLISIPAQKLLSIGGSFLEDLHI